MSDRCMLRRVTSLLLAAWLVSSGMVAHANPAAPLAADPALEARVMEVAEELRCLVCQNETIAASQAALAIDLRQQIRDKLRHGESKAQIVDFMTARYGDFVRYRPPFGFKTALLWIGPFALLLLAAFVARAHLHQRRRAPQPTPVDPAPPDLAAPQRADGPADRSATAVPPKASRAHRLALAFAPALFAIALYAAIGNPAAINVQATSAASPAADADASPEALEAMLRSVAQRLETPSADAAADAQGWTMLGRSYAALQRFADADRAFARAVALSPDNAQLLADRADVLTILQDRRSDGEPDRLVARALQIDPRNPKALALAGTAAFERRDLAAARDYWQRAKAVAPAGSEFAASLDRSLVEVSSQAAGPARPPAQIQPGPSTPSQITGRVSLSPTLAAHVAPGDTVFVFARAAEGPRMPLAIVRRKVADLPFDFTLDDTTAMSPQMKLSGADRVIVGARISRSGDAMPRAGDLRVDTAAMPTHGAGLQLVIDSVQP